MRIRILVVVLLFIGSNYGAADFSQLINDNNVYQEPNIPKPGYLQPYTDSVFGTTITRITDNITLPAGSPHIRHWYSRQNPWNADDSYLLLYNYNWLLYDPTTYQAIKGLNIEHGQRPQDPVWHPTDPNTLYYQYNNEMRELNVATNQNRTLRTFPSYPIVSTIMQGLTVTNDGLIALAGMSSKNNSDVQAIFVYNVFTDAVGTPTPISSTKTHWVGISHTGQYVIVMFEESSTPMNGVHLFKVDADLSLTFVDKIYSMNKHSDFALASDGSDVWVFHDYLYGCKTTMVTLSDQIKTVLQSEVGWSNHGHYSGRCTDNPGWVINSTYEPNPSNNWVPFKDEIWALKLDGSGEVRRIAHSHNTRTTYWEEPHAACNKDATKIMFRSNWRGSNVVDEYVVELPSLPPYVQQSSIEGSFNIGPNIRFVNNLKFTIDLPWPGQYRANIYDMLGRNIWSHLSKAAFSGTHQIKCDIGSTANPRLSNGLYVFSLSQRGRQANRRFVILH